MVARPARPSASAPWWRRSVRAAPAGRLDARRPRRRRRSARSRAAASRARSTSSAQEVVARGAPVLERYGVSDDDAFAVGLTCGGILDVFVEKVSRETFPELGEIAADIEAGRPVALATVIEHPDPGWLGPARRGPPRRADASGVARLGRAPTTPSTTTRSGCSPRAQRDPGLRPRRRAPRRGDAGLRVGVRAEAADAGLRRHRLRRRGGPGGRLPRLPRDGVRRPAGVRDRPAASPRPTRWSSTGRTATSRPSTRPAGSTSAP